MHLVTSEPFALTQSTKSAGLNSNNSGNSLTNPASTTTTTTTTSSNTRFVGKHAKDQKLSIFIQKRNINEIQGTGQVEEILGLVRISPETYRNVLQKGSSSSSSSSGRKT
jgi:hypothetical protein